MIKVVAVHQTLLAHALRKRVWQRETTIPPNPYTQLCGSIFLVLSLLTKEIFQNPESNQQLCSVEGMYICLWCKSYMAIILSIGNLNSLLIIYTVHLPVYKA